MSNLIKIALAAAIVIGLFLMIKNIGYREATDQVNASSAIVQNQADMATNVIEPIIITNERIIERNTKEVRDVIYEVPETGLNPISRARLERVRQQQQAVP